METRLFQDRENNLLFCKTDYLNNISSDNIKRLFSWEDLCCIQILEVISNKSYTEKNILDFKNQIKNNQPLIDYATLILEDSNLRENFEFLIKEYFGELNKMFTIETVNSE